MKIAALDVGGTSIKGAIIGAEAGKPTSSYSLLSFVSSITGASGGRDNVLSNIVGAASAALAGSDTKLLAVSSAGTVNWDTGEITYATDALPNFSGLKLAVYLTQTLGVRTIVINDAVAALIGEAFFDMTATGEKKLMLTLGTGLGSAITAGCDKLNASSVQNLQLAHLTLHEGGRRCACGKLGCAEQYVSATGIKTLAGDINETTMADINTLKPFFEDFLTVLKEAEKTLAPDKVIVGGGVVELKRLWWDNFLSQAADEGFSFKLDTAKLANKAGVFGAIYAALNGIFLNQ